MRDVRPLRFKSMRKFRIIVLTALIHFTASIIIIPVANKIDQKWFDTGIRGCFVEGVVHLSGLVLSFPCALWTFSIHPANANKTSWIISALVNSIVCGSMMWLSIGMRILRRRSMNHRNRSEEGVCKK